MMLATCATLAFAVLPSLPGIGIGNGGLPSLPDMGDKRPGPPNKGVVRWGKGDAKYIEVVDVEKKSVVRRADQQWKGIPSWLHWSTAHMTRLGAKGESIILSCPHDSNDNLPCTFYVTFVDCVLCSKDTNGGLPQALLAAGFTSGSCGPRFAPTFPDTPETFQTAIFRKTLVPGEQDEIEFTKTIYDFAVFELSIGQQCSIMGAGQCRDSTSCIWDSLQESCIDTPICPPRIVGPQPVGPGCKCPVVL